MKKKIMGLGVSAALAMSMCPVGMALAAPSEVTPEASTATMTVEKSIPTAYTITIPEKATVGTEVEVTAAGCVLPIGQSLTLTASDLTAKSSNDKDAATYALTTGVANEKVLIVAQGTDSGSGKFTFAFDGTEPTAAATYTAMVTFTASVA